MLKPTKESDEVEWYSGEKLQQLLEYYVDDNTVVTPALSTEDELKAQLDQYNNKQYQLVIPLNVNAFNGQLGENTNHWVGLYIAYSDDDIGGKIAINYIDPMGGFIDSALRDITVSHLNQCFPGVTIRVEHPLRNKAIQYTSLSGPELQGNTDDCGPMLVYAIACVNHNIELPIINDLNESRSLGSFLRESFDRKDDFITIHDTTGKGIGNYVYDQQNQSHTALNTDFSKIEVELDGNTIKRGDYQQNSDVIVPSLLQPAYQEYQISEDKGNQQLILNAARTGEVHRIQKLEEQGINLNEGTRGGYSILHYAVVNGMYELAEYLVQENRINVNSKDHNGQTALHLAVRYGNLAIVQLLAAYTDSLLVDENGNSLLHLAVLRTSDQTLDQKKENEEIITSLANHNADLVNCANYEGNTPLHLVVDICINNVGEDYLLIDQLLQLGADIKIENNDGYTPLHLVPVNNCNNIELIRALCKDNKNIINLPDKQGNTILHIASAKEMTDLITNILVEEGISYDLLYNLRNNQGRIPLHEAAWNGNLEIFTLLSKKSDLYIKDYNNCSMIHCIFHGANFDILTFFRSKLDINSSDFNNFASVLDKNGNSVWHYLARGSDKSSLENQQKIVDFLYYYYSDTVSLINQPNKSGNTPLHELLSCEKPGAESALSYKGSLSTGYFSTYSFLWNQYIEELKDPFSLGLLAQKGKNLNKIQKLDDYFFQQISKSSSAKSLQHVAAQHNESEFFDYTLTQSRDINQLGANKRTVLHYAAIGGNIEMVEKILKHKNFKHNIFTKDKNGITPVHLSSIHGHLELLKYFLEGPNHNFWQEISFTFSKDKGLKTSSSGIHSPMFSRKIKQKAEDDNANTYTFEGFKYTYNEDGSFKIYIPKLNGFTDSKQNNLLHFAAEHNLPELMEYLLGKGMDISITNIHGLSPLHIASLNGNFEVCVFLLDKNLEYKNSIENNRQRERNVFQDEIRYKEIEKQTSNVGQNILHYAIKSGNLKLIKHYVEELGMDINEGKLAFKNAILSKNVPTIWYVINNASEFKFTEKDKLFFNVIDIGDLGLIDHFSSQQPDVLNFKDKNNNTPLERVIINHDTKLLPFLVERSFDAAGQGYSSPLGLLVGNLKAFPLNDYGKCVKIIEQLLAYDNNIQPNNFKNIFKLLLNDTAELMQVMHAKDYIDVLNLIITKEVINFQNNDQQTIMHSLMQQLHELVKIDRNFTYQILEHFLSQGVNFTLKDREGRTAVELIALEELVSTVDHLLEFYSTHEMEIPDYFAVFNLLKNADYEELKNSLNFNNFKYGVLELYYSACHKNKKLFEELIVNAQSELIEQIKLIIESDDQFASKQLIITVAQAADTFLDSGQIQPDIIVPSVNSLVTSWLVRSGDTCLLTKDPALKDIFMQRCRNKKESEASFLHLVDELSQSNKDLLGQNIVAEMFMIGEQPLEVCND